ncbi:MAG: aminotransferase class I/II-fold pyridoxal phosphate-dependent enzyme [Alphaproteobacteria bacterium]|nr:aminotransferase class I/II-fold pyridoxal phosphate-dependent enzyme [Alphaproteobacteria bacterium]
MMKVAARGAVSPFHVMEVMREAWEHEATGADVIHLSVGQPAEEAPEAVRRKAAELLLSKANLGYTNAMGVTPLRKKIAAFYQQRYDVAVPWERVVVTIGSSSAFFISMLAAFDHGDSVAIAFPCYPAYPNMLEAAGLKPVFLRADVTTNFQPTIEMLEALPKKPDGLIIASPSNPAGTVIDPVAFAQIVQYCDANGIRLISDEIYHGITFDGHKETTAAALSDTAIVANSFSKYFLMPGWRLGWAIMPENLLRSTECLLQNFFISPPAISQYAAIEVFDCLSELDDVVAGYTRNRQVMLEALPKAGFTDLSPSQGAFYIYADVHQLTDNSEKFCREMLLKTGVAAVPGHDFDREQGAKFMRFSFCGKEDRVAEAMARISAWLQST